MLNPLLFATMQGGYTEYIKLLLKAGADPNIPDDVCFVYFFILFLTWYAAYHYIMLNLIVILL